MARGKYAAKANSQRAEAAGNTVVALRGQIDEMRRTHVVEVAELKAQINHLSGRLVSEVSNLAKAQVEEAKAEAEARVKADRAAAKERALKAMQVLGQEGVGLPAGVWSELWSVLELSPPEAMGGTATRPTRAHRRQSLSDFRKVTEAMRPTTAEVLRRDAEILKKAEL